MAGGTSEARLVKYWGMYSAQLKMPRSYGVRWGLRKRQAARIEKGSGVPHKEKVGTVTKAQVKEIAETKMPDLNANDIENAMLIIEGTARSMGLDVVDA